MPSSVDYRIVFQDFSEEDMADFISEHFDISLTPEELFRCETLGGLHGLVMNKLGGATPEGKCATQMTFYRLRENLRQNGIRRRLTPATPLSNIKGFHYGALFRHMEKHSGWRPVDVARPIMQVLLLIVFGAGVGALCLWVSDFLKRLNLPVWQDFIAGSMVFLMFLIGLVLVIVIFALLSQTVLPRRYPKNITTLGQLSEFSAGLNSDKLVQAGARLDERLVWLGLVALFADNHGEDLTKLTPQTRFA